MSQVGVIGGGQLAWMMGAAAEKLGIELYIQTPHRTDPAGTMAPPDHIVLAPVDDAEATTTLANTCDVVTFENEFVDLDALGKLFLTGVTFYPAIASLRPLLDKYHQRQCFQSLHIPTPRFMAVDSTVIKQSLSQQLSQPLSQQPVLGFLASTQSTEKGFDVPVVLKARRHGYDGQGTHIIKHQDELTQFLAEQEDIPWLLEEFVPFERELAVMAARSESGDIVVYPVVESQQEEQVCRRVFVLPNMDISICEQVEAIARKLLTHLNFVGVLGIEFFLAPDGLVLVNEVAPRTHNSGHYTIDACETSQFEQQLRAVTGLPLGKPTLTCVAAVMVNLLGYESSETPESDYQQKRTQMAALPHTQVYWYGKPTCRPGRKMGHVTAIVPSDSLSDTSSDCSYSSMDHPTLRSKLEAIAATIEHIWFH